MHRAGSPAVESCLCLSGRVSDVDRAAVSRVGGHGDGVGLLLCLEDGHKVSVGRHIEGIVGICRDLVAVFRPSYEIKALVGIGMHRAGLATGKGFLGLSRCVADVWRAAIVRVGRNGDDVLVGLLLSEMSHKVSVAGHGEGKVGFCRHRSSVFSPIHEIVARIGYGMYCTCLSIGICTLSCSWDVTNVHRAAVGWIGRYFNSVSFRLFFKVGH